MMLLTIWMAMLSFVWVVIMTIALERRHQATLYNESLVHALVSFEDALDRDYKVQEILGSSTPMATWDESFVDELFLP